MGMLKLKEGKNTKFRIICFPYAGASGIVFKELAKTYN